MARSRAAPSRSSAPRSSAPPAHHSTPHNQSHNQPPQVTNVYMQRGPAGAGGTGMLGTMAAVAGGSVLGHGISNYLYNNHNQAPTAPAEAQQLAQAAQQENAACAPHIQGYARCLEANENSADSCRWAWDYFLQCQREQPNASQ